MTQSEPLISTIIPTYRRPQLLARAVRSALRQSYPRLQVCVYDNASGDETAQVVAALAQEDPRVRYFCHPHNVGMIANFNYAFERITTPFYSFLSDDDVLLPSFYASALAGLEAHPDAFFWAGSTIQISSEGVVQRVPLDLWRREGRYAPPDGFLAILEHRHPTITGILFRKEARDRFGLFRPDVAFADLELEARIAAVAPYVVSKQPCALFVAHDASATATGSVAFTWGGYRNAIGAIKQNGDIPAELVEAFERVTLPYLRRVMLGWGVRAIARAQFADASVAASILGHFFNEWPRAALLRFAAAACRGDRRLQAAFRWLYLRLEKARDRRRFGDLQAKYGSYARFLREDTP